jgi:hypothetical protein
VKHPDKDRRKVGTAGPVPRATVDHHIGDVEPARVIGVTGRPDDRVHVGAKRPDFSSIQQ